MTDETERALDELVRPGARVAVADACGLPYALAGPLSRVAARRRDDGDGVRLVLGWIPGPAPDLDPAAFVDIRTVVGGPGARALLDSGAAQRVPARLSAVPALLAGPLRPDLLLATVVADADGYRFGAESSWMRGLADDGVPVAAVVSGTAPHAEAGPPLPDVTVVGRVDGPAGLPHVVTAPPPTDADRAIAEQVAALVPVGARIQFGPGRLAGALVAALDVPVHVDSGLLADAVVDLDERGLLLGTPSSTALCGSERLYSWAGGPGRSGVVRPIEYTHDLSRLSTDPGPLVALNTALEIDVHGQVNVEGVAGSAAGMIGGHPDFAAAAARGPGLSVIALPSSHRGGPTLVERLGGPVSTPSHDVDVVVTERGTADLRGLGRDERRRALDVLWSGTAGANE
ncbi:4-hydroxybutyrate coenzyme A transferase [Pseudonocardia sp. Ae168_Ps1]|uniref:acetyl-CoA hydrolase/transferase C-terminal domain-containing protein n=1 Tax=unclassified Pseudonocardia TaxID=2619320 RepID=UPI00094AACEA|nr:MULTISPECIES: acetyl-CoA hydrolase/transferase C-terminal domain-containing protein [unclassified Pseudonocardia]OLL76177.1 4-hydroxybutyrate coenzyme A transferase [Pseudonocardia sp. Ae150A_Ps1]OLL82176.1 4-hydroxybutyrate coenzyme A transferase [Pseudonocardia sp. Ae168_Ps1]OLL83710.1 4-hydroxybutyrate coenzyme A transferase [Pseudonocardia sp. Ae263_Ps1]OLL90250.1 4-hydroxybutyrate coenzyme A transferase [Pseudonocardia sp. Ae356_Ps1]